ncbi:MAG: BREX-1 system adenine-specific DNA-methyltransferase PglX, partial [Dehalococcoidia bacterium]|nr:BREX-1 system adenine-specific DNA-methyltransferase PglX [Dehalococcoidia bacterium]
MAINYQRTKQYLHEFQFQQLFIEELGWAHCRGNTIPIALEEGECLLSPFAQMGGMVIYQGKIAGNSKLPQAQRRISISREISKVTFEHMVIFTDTGNRESLWLWAKHEAGKPFAVKEHQYKKGMPGDSLLQKLAGIAFQIEDLDEEGKIAITDVKSKFQKQFDVEKVTKRFYDEFKAEHSSFAKFLTGIEVQDEVDWYISVMLNRLMFIYFIQKKSFLNGDVNYLANKLADSKKQGANQFYRKFLIPLFFEGFAKEAVERSPEINRLLGKVPYLNGGLFLPHQLELAYGESISISDAAFERLFAFFDRYSWHLDYRPLKADNEINPDVLGYIFEKYINQKQMGAYYTKEDITDYICKNTIIPFLFDKLENMRYEELHPFPMTDVEPYIYEAVKQEAYFPTETDREYKARQKRYRQIKDDFAAGKIANINDLITYNLDIRRFAEDWTRGITDPVTLRAFYFHCLTKVTILDPAVGSGAFLFAALNMLEPLYEIGLDKMQELGGPKYEDFAQELARVNQHPNRKYFVVKSIIVNNLFGVDIMEEAVEICKLRLFLKLVAQIDDVEKIEPLPDIDFNIRAGNTLVGYTNLEQIRAVTKVGAAQAKMDLGGEIERIDRSAQAVDRDFQSFRVLQTRIDVDSRELARAKAGLKQDLGKLQNELNRYLAGEYGVDVKNPAAHQRWLTTHQPFHWIVEFYSIMKAGGFDAIIGNPPYVEYKDVKATYKILNYDTEDCNNLFAYILERCSSLGHESSCVGIIVPLSAFSSDRMVPLISHIKGGSSVLHIANFGWRPGKLFEGVNLPLSIIIQVIGKPMH